MKANEIITEAGLEPTELKKHGGKYLSTLIQIAKTGPVEISPDYRHKFGNVAHLSTATISDLELSLTTGAPIPRVPFFVKTDPATGTQSDIKAAWGAIFKSAKFTGLAGKKDYNAGHLSELFMGLAVTAKFVNLGNPVSTTQLLDIFNQSTISQHSVKGGASKSIKFNFESALTYPETTSKFDNLKFAAIVPGMSAESFMSQVKSGKIEMDLQSLISSSVKFVNEADSVNQSIQRVRKDPKSNLVEINSDGTSESKQTKADLILSIDGSRVNLFSLKTYSTDTLGQVSGIGFDSLNTWFKTSFNIDISDHKNQFDPAQFGKDEMVKNLLNLYDTVIGPKVKELVSTHRAGQETEIVRQLASAANFYARGENKDDIEIVKLDDSVSSGNYKILKFSDNLYDAMKLLDLGVKVLGAGQGRTIQIFVRPDPNVVDLKGTDKLCQFRSQMMGGYLRNYFEIGPMMVKLTAIN